MNRIKKEIGIIIKKNKINNSNDLSMFPIIAIKKSTCFTIQSAFFGNKINKIKKEIARIKSTIFLKRRKPIIKPLI